MAAFLQLFVSGLATGAIYALVALGFTLLWQTSQTINFAQGEFVMIPAFFILAAMKFGGLDFWPACLVGLVVALLVLGLLFKRLIVDPMLRHGVLPLRWVLLPQALRNLTPSFVGLFVSLIKDTSLAFILNVPELTTVAGQINNRTQLYPSEIFLFTAALYFLLCGGVARLGERWRRAPP